MKLSKHIWFFAAASIVFAAAVVWIAATGLGNGKINNPTKMPVVMITEISPRTGVDGVSGIQANGDAFGFIEVYNNSASILKMKGYQLVLQNGSSEKSDLRLVSDFALKPEQTGVVWIQPGYSEQLNWKLSKQSFREFYKLSAEDLPDERIAIWYAEGEGLGLKGPQTVSLRTIEGAEAVQAAYNNPIPESMTDTRTGRSIVYSYPEDSSKKMQYKSGNQLPTPGKLLDNQIPNGKEFLITELMVNSSSDVGSLDVYAYVELFNKGRSSADLKEYQLVYETSEGQSKSWDLKEHLWINAGQAAVIWLKPEGEGVAQLTKADFRKHFGIAESALSDESVYELQLAGTGLEGDKVRARIALDRDGSGERVAVAEYNPNRAGEDTGAKGKSIKFSYPFASDDPVLMRRLGGNQKPDPGIVDAKRQIPGNTQLGYYFYYGHLHAHTAFSLDYQGLKTETPQIAYEYARDKGKADFLAVSDHTNPPYKDALPGGKQRWVETLRMADLINDDDKFVAIPSFEISWGSSNGRYGHMNSFVVDNWASPNDYSLKTFYDWLKSPKNSRSIAQFNHPSKVFGEFNDFDLLDAAMDEHIQLLEVDTNNHYLNYIRALDKGWHIGPTNNQDNHSRNWITADQTRTVVIAPRKTRQDIYEAFRQRRTLSTQDANAQVMYTVNGQLMGSILDAPKELRIHLDMYDPDPKDYFKTIEIISNSGLKIASWEGEPSNSVVWDITVPAEHDYYFARIMQADGHRIVTAPVWAGGAATGKSYRIPKIEYTRGSQISVGATVENPGDSPLEGVQVLFYKDELLPENKIGEALLQTIPVKGSAKAVMSNWTPPSAGGYKLLAEAVIPTGSTKRHIIGYTEVPELIITEVVASNGAPAGSTDPFEFIELYNNSYTPVDLSGHKIRHYSGAGPTLYEDWGLNPGRVIAPGESLVLWLKTEAAKSKTLADFNDKYNTKLGDSQVMEIAAGKGLNNNNINRLLFVLKSDDTQISYVITNKKSNGDDKKPDKAFTFEYPQTGTIEGVAREPLQTPTPGTIVDGQIAGAVLP
ncbi:hypothetical protein PAESOLCIP111_05160 [Paenibacillus solanacearum]|uniref:LTD domain-containing protein n=1 Tax=Paenibacillus solanacearum TaxID=2048548 RepID=A0A916K793_9BACL|nr:lamin tail domain-containing protein [Paenibacillus solanacearum]CAG7646402.1 hypothetical protein PAESOLCIP111_05160 [Paenibacillus solanacearum]